jgi:gamma-glutamylcyclotransferase (GGCT)/AIG2-like uncharacterized protein YtfP
MTHQKMPLVFTYGSLSPEIMVKDVGLPLTIWGVGQIEDMTVVFSSKIKKWGMGGVAGLEPKTGHSVKGVIYQLTSAQLKLLDSIEGSMYERKTFDVRLPKDNKSKTCFAYVKVKQTRPLTAPSYTYRKHMQILHRIYRFVESI